MSSQDPTLPLLKIAVHFLNENSEELDFGLGHPLNLDDLNKLSSINMLKIITFLLRDVIGEKPVTKTASLTEFNKFGIGNVTYDCGIDEIYHTVKQIFPDQELFHYSVLFLPATYPRKAKMIIAYIMSFVLMCDDLHEEFIACYESVAKENEEKMTICGEIEDIKEQTAALIQQRESEKERLPSMEKELQNTEDNIRKQQGVLSNLIAELGKHKIVFERKHNQLKTLETVLNEASNEKRNLESQIVLNPADLIACHEGIKQQITVGTKQREGIGSELETLRKEGDLFESLIGRANDAIQNFESVFARMADIKLRIESYTKTGNEQNVLARKISALKTEKDQLSHGHAEKVKDAKQKAQLEEAKLKQFADQEEKLKREILAAQCEQKSLIDESKRMSDVIVTLKDSIYNYQKQIDEILSEIEAIPEQRQKLIQERIQYIKDQASKSKVSSIKLPKND